MVRRSKPRRFNRCLVGSARPEWATTSRSGGRPTAAILDWSTFEHAALHLECWFRSAALCREPPRRVAQLPLDTRTTFRHKPRCHHERHVIATGSVLLAPAFFCLFLGFACVAAVG